MSSQLVGAGLEAARSATSSIAAISPTLSMHLTQAGMILGTAAYMSVLTARLNLLTFFAQALH